jgi:hypothetical protein
MSRGTNTRSIDSHCPFVDQDVSLVSPDVVSTSCRMACQEAACCLTSEQGQKYERCLAQLRRRLGEDPEPGDKCGSCGMSWQ